EGQGTMNNVTLGAGGWTYYETIGGGQGASHGAPGPSGVHVGMSNTRNTPVEVLEMEYPLRVKSYALRRGSGGGGRWTGGEGVIRELVALAPMEASMLAGRRRHAPRGAGDGRDGAGGATCLDGARRGPRVGVALARGPVWRLE